jgi:hypothetical protein
MESNDFYMAESMCDAKTWFIFRENGIEIKIVLDDEKFKTTKELTALEIDYLNNNLR